MAKPVLLTQSDFLNHTKVLRMLYGERVARDFYEKNFQEFTGVNLKELHILVKNYHKAFDVPPISANIKPPRDIQEENR